MRTGTFIDGRFAAAADGQTFATVSPRDGSEIAQVARGGAADVDRAVAAIATPFGGFKDSGHGRDRSLHTLEGYTQLKTTWISLA